MIKVVRSDLAVRADYRTAQVDLGATDQQAFLVAANALAWRLAALMLPTAALVDVILLLTGVAGTGTAALVLGFAVFGPFVVVILVTFPVAFIAGIQSFHGGTDAEQIRFGTTSLVYQYYGWRYAFRGRTRPWGALTLEEKRFNNRGRAEAWWATKDDG